MELNKDVDSGDVSVPLPVGTKSPKKTEQTLEYLTALREAFLAETSIPKYTKMKVHQTARGKSGGILSGVARRMAETEEVEPLEEVIEENEEGLEKSSDHIFINIKNTEAPREKDGMTPYPGNGDINLCAPRSLFPEVPFDAITVENPEKFLEFAQAIVGCVNSRLSKAAFADPFVGNTKKLTNGDLTRAIRLDISAEYEAVALYTAHADSCSDEKVKKVLNDIAAEEVVHIGELQKLIEVLNQDEAQTLAEGYEEAEEVLGSDVVKSKFTDKPWDGSASRFTDEQLKESCLIDLNKPGEDPVRSLYKLPIKEPNGTININAVRNALARLPQTKATRSKKESAKTKLEALLAEYNSNKVEKSLEQILKSDDEKHLIYGPVLIPDIEDLQKDVLSSDEIEKACHDYNVNSRVVWKSHKEPMKADIVESYCYHKFDVPEGTWIAVTHIPSDSDWQDAKKNFTGYSIGGRGNRTPV